MHSEKVKRNERLEGIFNRVAANYDSIGPNYFTYFGQKLVEYATIKEESTLLDVACGKGASLFPASHSVGEKGHIIGIDFSQEMINETQLQIHKQNLCNAKLIQMDAELLDFPDNYFDNVLCGLAITFFSNPISSVEEMYRVLKDGGKLGLSTWKQREQRGVLDKAYSKAFPEIQQKKSVNVSSRPDFGSIEGIERILKNAGFRNIDIIVEEKTFYYNNEEEWWQEQWTNATRGFFEHIDTIGPDALNKFKETAFNVINEHKDAQGIRFDAKVLISFGYK
ncbi:class I SAM-dependent methyltransferase [Alkaliphilus hydrothermalis]|uniref:Ubiquinone/menaquinone biosynthesis C-methylase UbiE n=1 Tax=Alkaliphilus hydrothermalis TaxID=1482730 RepID=A0ABS2NT88_9FIRM|nr:class I SAM-dependent methyltransferase [Alkaliphilus hydrothermalis]MBM7616184.1 ubiquinone/menaquinone biosynthesis C-methylase UbiE [Alkaliphilus hydrothermalis]